MTETKVRLVRMNYASFSRVSQQKLWLVEAVLKKGEYHIKSFHRLKMMNFVFITTEELYNSQLSAQ